MKSLVPYRRYSLFDDFDRTLSRLFSEASHGACTTKSCSPTSWTPAVDVSEEEGKYVIQADIPGVKPEDIEVTFDDGVLKISGTRDDVRSEEGAEFKRYERHVGSFSRAFQLGSDVDAEAITASGKDGVLRVEIPKLEKVQPKRIEVH